MSGTIPASVVVTWAGEGRFDAGRPKGPTVRLDSSARTGPSPVDALLAALGSCTGVDVVDILAKRRTPADSLRIDVQAERFDGTPKRVVHVTLHYTITGNGIERVHAERAIALAVDKYCSVKDSLRTDIPVEWTLILNGDSASGNAAPPV
ncbi:MAG: OsmC family protein [Gemmatimonadota bacterium]|nr:OsmC family protein [Gemmatimonadota bacterium]